MTMEVFESFCVCVVCKNETKEWNVYQAYKSVRCRHISWRLNVMIYETWYFVVTRENFLFICVYILCALVLLGDGTTEYTIYLTSISYERREKLISLIFSIREIKVRCFRWIQLKTFQHQLKTGKNSTFHFCCYRKFCSLGWKCAVEMSTFKFLTRKIELNDAIQFSPYEKRKFCENEKMVHEGGRSSFEKKNIFSDWIPNLSTKFWWKVIM